MGMMTVQVGAGGTRRVPAGLQARGLLAAARRENVPAHPSQND